jgi:O-antigen ligase
MNTEKNGKKDVKIMLFQNKNFLNYAKFFLLLFFLFFPFQTIWIYREIFWDGFKWQYGTLGIYFSEIILWLFIVFGFLWIWQNKIKNYHNLKRHFKQNILLFTFAGVALIFILLTGLWSPDSGLAFQKARQIIEIFLFFLVFLSLPIGINFFIKSVFVGSVLPVFLGIYQFISQNTFASSILGLSNHPSWEGGTAVISGEFFGRWLRAYGTFSHPNIFGGYLFIVIVGIIFYFFRNRNFNPLKLFCLLIAPVIAIFFSFSRSAWFATILFLLYFFIYSFIKKRDDMVRSFFYLGFLVVALLFVFFPLVESRFTTSSSIELTSINERVLGIVESITIIKQNLLFGVGVGNYTLALKNSIPNLDPWVYQPVHNVWLLLISELGLIGFLSLTIFAYLILYKLCSAKKMFFWLLLTPFLIISLFDHYLYSSYSGLFFIAIYVTFILSFCNVGSFQPTKVR